MEFGEKIDKLTQHTTHATNNNTPLYLVPWAWPIHLLLQSAEDIGFFWDSEQAEKTWKKGKRCREKEEYETVVKRKYVNPVSIEAFDIFSQGEISECDSCGDNSDCESRKWSSVLVSNDVHVRPCFELEVVGGGEPSDSGWDFAVSGVLVGSDVCHSVPFVVTVMCDGVPSDSMWDFAEPQSFSFSKKRAIFLEENQGEMSYQGTPVKRASEYQKKDVAAHATGNFTFING